jgi:hypothetical protein
MLDKTTHVTSHMPRTDRTPLPDKRGQTPHQGKCTCGGHEDPRAQDTAHAHAHPPHCWLIRFPHVRTCPRRPRLPGALPTLPRLAPSRAVLSSSRPPTHRSTRTRPRASMHRGRSTGLGTWWPRKRHPRAPPRSSTRRHGTRRGHCSRRSTYAPRSRRRASRRRTRTRPSQNGTRRARSNLLRPGTREASNRVRVGRRSTRTCQASICHGRSSRLCPGTGPSSSLRPSTRPRTGTSRARTRRGLSSRACRTAVAHTRGQSSPQHRRTRDDRCRRRRRCSRRALSMQARLSHCERRSATSSRRRPSHSRIHSGPRPSTPRGQSNRSDRASDRNRLR